MSEQPHRPLYWGIAAGVIGAGLVWFPALWIMQKGLLSTFLIGAVAGIGGRWGLGRNHRGLAILAASVAFGTSMVCHWRFAPFQSNSSLGYFIIHMFDLGWKVWGDLIVGTCLAFYIVNHRIPNDTPRGSDSDS